MAVEESGTDGDRADITVGAPPRALARTWLGLAVVLTGAFVAMLDTFIVNVAVPSIRQGLHASYSDGEFVIAGYMLTYAIGQITGGRLGDSYGRRRVFSVGVGVFTVASGLCALAPSPEVLIAGRLIQGVGAALLTPQVLAIIRASFTHPDQRARAFAAMGVVVGLASVTGQILGGLLLHANLWGLTWRPIFLINIPLGVVTMLAAPVLVAESRTERQARLDRSGVALSMVGLLLLVFPLIEAPASRWRGWPLVMLAAAAVMLGTFVADQIVKTARGRAPLIDTRLFTHRGFVVGALAVLGFSATMPSLYLAFTLLLQNGFGADPLRAGLYFAPLALAFSLASFIAGRLTRFSARHIVISGALLNVVGNSTAALLCLAAPQLVPGGLIPAIVIIGAGTGLFFTPLFNLVLSPIADRHIGTASGTLSTAQRLGNALGVAILEIPFLLTYQHLVARGTSPTSSYISAYGAISVAVALTCTTVVAVLLALPSPAKPSI
jgi:EmrB/QacA subfamily drug resistance transporter